MRQVTVSAANLVDLNKLARSDPDSGANGVTVRSCSHELQTYPVPGPGTSVVPQQHGRAVEIVDHDVDVPVLVEVAKSGSARRAGLRQRLPGGCGDFLERAVPEIAIKQLPLTVITPGIGAFDLGIDVPVDHEQVQPAVVVVIEEFGSPAHVGNARVRGPGLA